MQSLHKIQAYVSWGHHMDWRLLPRTALALEIERQRLEASPGLTPGLNIGGLNELGVTLTDLQRFLEEQR